MNTTFLLMAEFNTCSIPLKEVAEKYFSHSERKMQSYARQQQYPFPVFRGGKSQKAEWLVSVQDLAAYIDAQRAEAQAQHLAVGGRR